MNAILKNCIFQNQSEKYPLYFGKKKIVQMNKGHDPRS